ncbi:46 kDa FK506-binding nuclear protein [Chrysoperla carnea]|uniref:46 kDa FK506-binding nuclear protein n=1 Tax=Chrysoperla carnea TaxID=189513 RepID=UPI001D07176B|nr:46 kDa FK506-binding nuclear protein [Chrysoperla carnea]
MFWGLIIEPNKRYTQTVQRSFHISMAALDASSSDDTNVQVMLGLNDKNYLLCTLNRNSVLQTSLDLNFQEGNKIAFLHNGKGYVHLTGYFVPEDDLMDEYGEEEGEAEDEEVPTLVKVKSLKRKSESESDKKKSKKKKAEDLTVLLNDTLESDDNDDSFTLDNEASSDEDDDDEDEDDDDDDDAEEEDDDSDAEDNSDEEDEDGDEDDSDDMNAQESEDEVEVKKPKKEKKKKLQLNGTASPDKKQKNKETPSKKGNNQDKQSQEKQQNNKKNENQQNNKKNENQQKKKEKNEKKLNNESSGNNDVSPQKKTLEGGVHIEDLKVGNGPVAKPGKFVQVYYEGRLKSNGKQFDASKSGPGFKFRLGRKEVIQGWDVGVAGMRVGGRRRITCPPNMAYGAKGSPPVIPPHSTLVFEVELKNVN